MKKLTTLMTSAVTTVLILSSPTAVLAQDTVNEPIDQQKKGRHHQRGGQSMQGVEKLMRAIKQLDLDEAQKDSTRAIMQTLRQDQREITQEIKAGHEQLKDLIKAETYDEEAVAALAEREGLLVAERLIITSKAMSEIYGLLTDEQRLELEAMAEKRKTRKGERRQYQSDEG